MQWYEPVKLYVFRTGFLMLHNFTHMVLFVKYESSNALVFWLKFELVNGNNAYANCVEMESYSFW